LYDKVILSKHCDAGNVPVKIKKEAFLQHSAFTMTYTATGWIRLSKKGETDARRDARVVDCGDLESLWDISGRIPTADC